MAIAQINQIANGYVNKRENVVSITGVIQQEQHYIKELRQVGDENCVLPDNQTIYEIGSVTKVFAGTVLAKLLREGKVALDAPIQPYLPEVVVSPLSTSV